jgi:predicted ribosomally synthesized peptide with SipW-like signal peptide
MLSLLVIAAVVAVVAGITYAVFTDNVASDDQWFDAGTVDIVVNEDEDDHFETTVHMTNMEAGDCATPQPISIHNAGTLPVYYTTWIYPHGDIFGCDPNPACSMQVWYDGPSGGSGSTFALDPSEVENLQLNACLPLCAGNNCQGKTGYFRMFIHAWQQSHLEDYTCIKMEDKSEATDWMPDQLSAPHGNICFKVVPDQDSDGQEDLHVIVNAYGLTADACFQLDLTGGDTNDPYDAGCQTQDDNLAGMSSDLYEAGYWNWGTNLESTCAASNGGEGVWNYAGVYEADKVCADDTGAISYEGYLTGLPVGSYHLKAHVKEISNPWPGDDWTEVLAEMDYLVFDIH